MITCKKKKTAIEYSGVDSKKSKTVYHKAERGLINDIFRLTSSKEEKETTGAVVPKRTHACLPSCSIPGLRIANWPAR